MVWPFQRPKRPQDRALLSDAATILLGIAAFLALPLGRGSAVPVFGMIAILAWVLLGVLWVTRRNPQIPNPAWLRPPWSAADWG